MFKKLPYLFLLWAPLLCNTQEAPISTEQFLNDLDQKIPEVLSEFSIPGAAVLIIEDGEIAHKKGYGFANLENGTAITEKTGFNIGSISKTVAAWGVMKLVQEGKIDLDTPVENYLTRWQFPKSEFDSEKITMRRLLSHTAGLSVGSVSAGPPYDNLPTLVDWLNGKNDGLGAVKMVVEPGTEGRYSGGGYGVCQLIIEEVSGQKFEDYMQEHILDPLGMTNSSYKIDDKILANSASPYDRYGEPSDFELFTAQAGAGLHTTLDDFTRFAFASLHQHPDNSAYNPVLSPETIRIMMEPEPITKQWAWSYCKGYQALEMGPAPGFRGHGGTNTGWQANFWINTATNDGFVVFTNGGNGGVSNLLFCRWVAWKSGTKPWDACNPKPSIAGKLKRYIDKEGIADIEPTYTNLKEDQPKAYDFSEGQLNDLGYYFMGRKEMNKALAIFQLNIKAFPYAFNVYDSYGEALLANGQRKKGIENYRRSIQLNPNNQNGVDVLRGIGEPTDDILIKIPEAHLNKLAGEYLATHDDSWTIVVEVEDRLLKCEDKYYNFTLVPIGNDKFVNPRFGALWRFDTTNPNAKPVMLFGERKFLKVK